VLRGAAAAPHVLCAYLRDSGTARHEEFDPFSCRAARRQELARAGEECLPGCTPTHWQPSADGPFWCAAADAASAATARACADEKRPFRGGDLRGMSAAWAALRATMAEADCVAGELAKHTCTFFNEVVLDASGFPQIVEALFTHAPGSVFDRRARPPRLPRPPPPHHACARARAGCVPCTRARAALHGSSTTASRAAGTPAQRTRPSSRTFGSARRRCRCCCSPPRMAGRPFRWRCRNVTQGEVQPSARLALRRTTLRR